MDDSKRIASVRKGSNFGDTTPEVKYNLDDHLGSSNISVDENGTLVNREEYYPFGETSFGSYSKKRYRFCGKEKDEESGLYYYGARYYSPWTCRFISVDPQAGKYISQTPYTYADNNPICKMDYNGEGTDGNGQPVPNNQIQLTINLSDSLLQEKPKTPKSDNLKQTKIKLLASEIKKINEFINFKSLSSAGVDFLKKSEGGFQSKVYNANTQAKAKFDSNGKIIGSGDWTIGYGHKLTKSEIDNKIFNQNGIDEKQAESLLLKDVKIAESKILALSKIILTQNEFDALVSFAYQQGIYNKTVKNVMLLINSGKLKEASTLIENTGNKTYRRKAEANIFSKGIYLPPQYYQNPEYYKKVDNASFQKNKNPIKR